MWKIQLLTAWRRLKNNKPYAIINIAGLGASLACAILLYLFINYHLRFDNFHPDADRIYRISSKTNYGGMEDFNAGIPHPLGKTLRNEYALFDEVAMRVGLGSPLVSIKSASGLKKFDATSAFAEPSYFRILNFPLVSGNANVLNDPANAIVTEKMAEKLYPGQDPVGKPVSVAGRDFTIKGIAKDYPQNTDHRIDIFLSHVSYKDWSPYMYSDSSWGSISSSIQCFVKLKPGIKPEQVEAAFPQIIKKYNPDEVDEMFFVMYPLNDVHFDTRFSGTIQRKYLWSLAWMGIFLVFTACINFINLSTAQSIRRSREIGVRKALGSTRLQIFGQFLSETFLLVAASVALAATAVSFSVPYLNKQLSTDITLDGQTLGMLIIFSILLLLVVMLLAGYYPGVKQARLNPVKAIRAQTAAAGQAGFPLRKTLIVVQFAIMQVMIVGAIVIARQMHYSLNGDKNMHKKGVLLVDVPDHKPSTMQTLRNRITQLAGVQKTTYCSAAPLSNSNMSTSLRVGGKDRDEDFQVAVKYADANYLSTFDIQLVAGTNIPMSDTANGMLVNEMLLRKLNYPSPDAIIGTQIRVNNVQTMVRGVFRDFHSHSFHSDMDPLCLFSQIGAFDEMAIRIDMQQASTLMPAIEKIWNETFPDYLYHFRFMEEEIANMYEAETMLMQLVEIFAVVAVLIGCLGLYGLISFMAVQKKKEIGVRKVLGASVPSVVWLFGREFTWMLVAGFVLSAPLSWWLMNSWLEGFYYRIDLGPEIYLVTVLLCACITLLTVGYTSVRAALMNPAVSLKTE
ncbi:ABC transporter permease [Chitinophaga caseinilytica]|uniref:ABC transporter permease n=1 Tax=Chitinophaga caseinilytica TaxID=2267521 RepID=UPI003C2F82CA